jgi:transposase-like protein
MFTIWYVFSRVLGDSLPGISNLRGNNLLDTQAVLDYSAYVVESKAMKAPKTLQEAINHFADPEQAFVYAVNWRWPDGVVTCPRCGGTKHSFIKTRWLWFCKGCKRQFTVKVGTIFEDSPIGIDKWMIGMWMLVNCKNGVSSYELAKTIGITQKSAWFMLQRLRLALRPLAPQEESARNICCR